MSQKVNNLQIVKPKKHLGNPGSVWNGNITQTKHVDKLEPQEGKSLAISAYRLTCSCKHEVTSRSPQNPTRSALIERGSTGDFSGPVRL